ncbi:MAG TPA: transglutaminase domain-containing protein, partial [Myxococcaceae bacterium]|nr:transglutaminase domain-containing protein [Myxococcaceae bacterium]
KLAVGAWPSALWLWRTPVPGCVPGHEELTGRTGTLCAEPAERGAVRGTLFGEPFHATFHGGRLQVLSLGDARFTAIPEGTEVAWPPDLFGKGVPVAGTGGVLALEPPRPQPQAPLRPGWSERDARALAREVHGAIADKRPSAADLSDEAAEGTGSCLAHARRFLRRAREQGRDAAIVHGLLALPGETRASPHVWVRVALTGGRTLDLDPTSLDEVGPSTHAALAVEGAGASPGAAFLRLFSGQLRVVRR